MSEKKRKLIIDNNSLIDFFNYYYFDRDNGNKIYTDINEFLFLKIKSEEVIIIDKVFNKEFLYIDDRKSLKSIKARIRPYVVNTDHLIQEVEDLSQKHYLQYNEKFISDPTMIVVETDKILESADLYLVALCMQYKNEGINPILVTEESPNKTSYKKLIDKIPSICRKEDIESVRLPHSLFNIYKDELEFDLKTK